MAPLSRNEQLFALGSRHWLAGEENGSLREHNLQCAIFKSLTSLVFAKLTVMYSHNCS